MPIINGLDRHQIRFSSLEDTINADNDVRFIDAFVDKSDLHPTTKNSASDMLTLSDIKYYKFDNSITNC